MDRRQFIKGSAVAAAGGAVLAAPAIAKAEPVIRWRCVSSFPKTIEVLYGCAEVMANNLREATDGKFDIQVFAAGEVVPGLQAFDAASQDTVEMCHTASYYYTGKDPAFAFGACLPFGLNTREQNAWFYHGDGGKLLADFYADYNVVALAGGNTGAQMGGWFRDELKSLGEMKGLKFRISGLGGEILSRIGAVPQQVGGGDIYPALERGTIDAAEFNAPHDDEKLGLYKIAPYYYYPGWWDGTSMQHFFINTKHWQALPKHYQAALKSAAALSNIDAIARYDALNPPALRRLIKAGAQLRAMPQDIVQASYDAAMGLYEELSDKNPAFKTLYENYRDFHAQSRTWNQVSEYAYNNSVLRQSRG